MKIAFNSPVLELYFIPLSCHKIGTDGLNSVESSCIHPIAALPQGGKQEGECGKKERVRKMGDGDSE